MIHQLKTWPEFLEDVAYGTKTFELRKNDREYRVGDTLFLVEWDPTRGVGQEETGLWCAKLVTYVLSAPLARMPDALPDGMAVLGLGPGRLTGDRVRFFDDGWLSGSPNPREALEQRAAVEAHWKTRFRRLFDKPAVFRTLRPPRPCAGCHAETEALAPICTRCQAFFDAVPGPSIQHPRDCGATKHEEEA